MSDLSTMTVMQLRRLQGVVSEELSFRTGDKPIFRHERNADKAQRQCFEIDFSDRWRATCVALLLVITIGVLLAGYFANWVAP